MTQVVYSVVETINGVPTTHTWALPPTDPTVINAAQYSSFFNVPATPNLNPVSITDNTVKVQDNLGGVLSLDVNGFVYRNGLKLGQAQVSQLLSYGDGLFGKGKTSGLWYQWLGTSWVQLSNYDPMIFV